MRQRYPRTCVEPRPLGPIDALSPDARADQQRAGEGARGPRLGRGVTPHTHCRSDVHSLVSRPGAQRGMGPTDSGGRAPARHCAVPARRGARSRRKRSSSTGRDAAARRLQLLRRYSWRLRTRSLTSRGGTADVCPRTRRVFDHVLRVEDSRESLLPDDDLSVTGDGRIEGSPSGYTLGVAKSRSPEARARAKGAQRAHRLRLSADLRVPCRDSRPARGIHAARHHRVRRRRLLLDLHDELGRAPTSRPLTGSESVCLGVETRRCAHRPMCRPRRRHRAAVPPRHQLGSGPRGSRPSVRRTADVGEARLTGFHGERHGDHGGPTRSARAPRRQTATAIRRIHPHTPSHRAAATPASPGS